MTVDREVYTWRSEEELGRKMLALARAEGHNPRFLGTEIPLRSSRKRRELRSFLKNRKLGTVTVRDIEDFVKASPDTIRRICAEFAAEGWLRVIKTKQGFLYEVLPEELAKLSEADD